MSELVKSRVENEIAFVGIDHPPVNALSDSVCSEVQKAVEEFEQDSNVKAILLYGEGRTFVAGADIRELQVLAESDRTFTAKLQDFIQRIEDCQTPVVAAMHGTVLGGGLELAMGCHARIALGSTHFGQPEVELGLIPGAAGTQRLPRLVGPVRAAEMCSLGGLIQATEALEIGLIDELAEDDLLTSATDFILDDLLPNQAWAKTSERNVELERFKENSNGKIELDRVNERLSNERPSEYAPQAAFEAVVAATTMDFEKGCQFELKKFNDCIREGNAAAMIHCFFAQREVGKQFWLDRLDRPKERPTISQVIVAGQPNETWLALLERCKQPVQFLANPTDFAWEANAELADHSLLLVAGQTGNADWLKLVADCGHRIPDMAIVFLNPIDPDTLDKAFPTLLISTKISESKSIEVSNTDTLSSQKLALLLEWVKSTRRTAIPTCENRFSWADRFAEKTLAALEVMREVGFSKPFLGTVAKQTGLADSLLKSLRSGEDLDVESKSSEPLAADEEALVPPFSEVLVDVLTHQAVLLREFWKREESQNSVGRLNEAIDMAAVLGGAFPKASGAPLWRIRDQEAAETIARIAGYREGEFTANSGNSGSMANENPRLPARKALLQIWAEETDAHPDSACWQACLQDSNASGN